MSNSIDRNIPMVAFRRGTLENLVYRMGLGEWIEPSEISAVLRKHAGTPYPPEIVDLICRRLAGDDRSPKGRPPHGIAEDLKRALGAVLYNKYYNWLKKRHQRIGLDGWTQIRGADWWQGAPSERAARMVQRILFRTNSSWRHVRHLCKSG